MRFAVIVISMDKDSFTSVRNTLTFAQDKIFFLKASIPADLETIEAHGLSKISLVERAIALSHRRARDFALSVDSDWILIFEDDVIQYAVESEILELLDALDHTLGTHTPNAVHFCPEQFGILTSTRKRDFYSTIILADCAVAYALNRRALEDSDRLSFSMNEVADWPKSLRTLNWYSPKNAFFGHPDISDPNIRSLSKNERGLRRTRISAWSMVLEKRTYKTLLFLFLSRFGKIYGKGYVADSRFRSRVIRPYLK